LKLSRNLPELAAVNDIVGEFFQRDLSFSKKAASARQTADRTEEKVKVIKLWDNGKGSK
jgi:hypothetical protein